MCVSRSRLLFVLLLTLAALPARGEPPAQKKPPVRLDRYGDPLPEGAIARLGTVRFRDGDGFGSLAYTPDGRFLIAGTRDGVRVLDAATGKEVRRIGTGQPNEPVVGISLDARLYASTAMNGSVHEVSTGRRISNFKRHPHTACFSPDGKILAACSPFPDRPIDLYDSTTGMRLRSLNGHQGVVYNTLFSRDGSTLVSGSSDRTIRFWDVAAGKEVRRFAVCTGGAHRIALSPDGSMLASNGYTEGPGVITGDDIDQVLLWDVASGKEVRQIITPSIARNAAKRIGVSVITFTPDSKLLLIGGPDDGMLTAWDAATGKELRRFTDQGSSVQAIAFHPDGKAFAVADADCALRVRDLATGRDIIPTVGHRDMPEAIAFSPDGRMVATTGRDRTICLWDVPTCRELRRLVGHELAVHALKFSADGLTLFSAGYDKTLVWNPATGQTLRRLQGTKARALALSPNGRILAVVGDGMFLLIDAVTGKELRRLVDPLRRGMTASFSCDGLALLVWEGFSFQRWDVVTGKLQPHQFLPAEKHRRSYCGFMDVVAFSADGRFVALGLELGLEDEDKYIPVIDVATGKQVCRFTNKDRQTGNELAMLALSPDGRTLAWSNRQDSVIRLGEVATGRERHHVPRYRNSFAITIDFRNSNSLAFSPDSKLMVSGCSDTTCLVWPLTGRLWNDKEHSAPLSETSLASSWEDLRSEDAAKAYVALRRLTGDPVRSLPYFKQRLHPAAALGKRLVARLIADLDSEEFAVREKATLELEKLGELAESDLHKTLAKQPSLEVRRRIELLLGRLNEQHLRQWRALEVLERIGTPEARESLKTLAQGAPEARLTQEAKAALERLAKRSSAAP